jgi:hypothetical protein
MKGSFGSGLGCASELFSPSFGGLPRAGANFFGGIPAALSPAIIGWIATSQSISAGLPLLAFAFFLIAPLFLLVAKGTLHRELADFIGQEQPASRPDEPIAGLSTSIKAVRPL